jgi:DNA-binding response OmpR family regulator
MRARPGPAAVTVIGRSTTHLDEKAATTLVRGTVRRVANEVRTLVAELDRLRSENEVLRTEGEELLAVLTAITRWLGRRTRVPRTPARTGPSRRRRREVAVPERPDQELALQPGRPRALVAIGGLQLDRTSRSVRLEGHDVPLAPREFDLLAYLLDHPGEPLTHQTLVREVWSISYTGDSRALRWHVNAIRAKLERFGPVPVQITTLHRIGYRLDQRDDAGGQR